MSDSFDNDAAAPTDAQRRWLQQLRLAANTPPGQTSAPPSVPNVTPAAVPVVQAPAPDGMLQAIHAANATAPATVPPDQSSLGQVPTQAPQPAAGGMLQALRDSLNTKIDNVVDAQYGFDENGKANPLLSGVANVGKGIVSYVPGPASDIFTGAFDVGTDKSAIKDVLHTGVDTAFDPATRERVLNGVGRGVQQGLSGFNEGLGNVVFAPADLLDRGTDYVAGKLAAAFGATPPAVQRTHDYYNRAFVDPAGQPETKLEQRIRGTARSFGTDLPALLVGGGLAAAGARSGVTLAEQEAPGLLEAVRAPVTEATHYTGKVSVPEVAGFLSSKLKQLVPNFLNALHPTNVANAVRASNMQGAADRVLERVAAHPYLTTYGDMARDWRAEKKREAQAAAQQVQP